jgi:signal transduction histidine kinase
MSHRPNTVIHHPIWARPDKPETIAASYQQALAAFLATGSEHGLMEAYKLARDALSFDLSIIDFWVFNDKALASMPADLGQTDLGRERAWQFALEFLSVYDMALKGYEQTVPILTNQIAERQRIEQQLRATSFELATERDSLEAKVVQRTQELAEKAADLEKTLDQLRQTNREQASFTYSLSHDLKSPSNTIAMLVGELRQEHGSTIGDDGQELLDLIQQTTKRMSKLVDDVLDYSRCIEVHPDHGPVDLNALLPDLVADLRYDIARTGAQIDYQSLPVVRGDRMQLRLLLQNLVANAVKFHKPHRPPKIRIRGRALGGNQVMISVSDNGIGIASQHFDRIFGLFQRLHAQDEYTGSGIGLALCRRIALNHGSDITVKSRSNFGSVFYISLERYPA